jgi:hypothetical protein
MNKEKTKPEISTGEMHKRREKMADGQRYIIYYTFGTQEIIRTEEDKKEAKENV